MSELNRQTVLDQEALFAACRVIYELAGDHFALPPLIRDVRDAQALSNSVFNCHAGDCELYFHVALDASCADRNARPHSKLPLKFHAELRGQAFRGGSVELRGRQKNELARAFLLGMKAPLTAETVDGEPGLRLSIQLASTFFVDCGALSEVSADSVPKDICDRVGERLYERSRAFLPDRKTGIDLWSARAAQDLFGEARPAAETFWPIAKARPELAAHEHAAPAQAAAEAMPRAEAPLGPAGAGWLRSRYAVAAAVLAGLLFGAGLGMSLTLRMAPAASIEPAKAPQTDGAVAARLESVNVTSEGMIQAAVSIPAPGAEIAPTMAATVEAQPQSEDARSEPSAQEPVADARHRAPELPNLVQLASVAPVAFATRIPTSDVIPDLASKPRPASADRISDRRPAKPVAAAPKAKSPVSDRINPPKPMVRPVANTTTPWARRAVVNVRHVLQGIGRIPDRIAMVVKAPSSPR